MTGSCVQPLEPMFGQRIELTFVCDDDTQTKVQIDGEPRYRENLFTSVDVFFYQGLDEEHLAYHERKEIGGISNSVSLNFNVSNAVLRDIFPEEVPVAQKDQAKIFVVANCPEDFDFGSDFSLSALKARIASTPFLEEDALFRQDHFLMSCESIIHLQDEDATIVNPDEDPIWIERNACKVTASLFVKDRVELKRNEEDDEPQIWVPIKQNIQIYLVNGFSQVRLDGEEATLNQDFYFDYSTKPRYYFNESGEPLVGSVSKQVKVPDPDHSGQFIEVSQVYYSTHPMYTYPLHWGETTLIPEPYLKIVCPWAQVDENNHTLISKPYYYRIFLPDTWTDDEGNEYPVEKRFVRNHWYHYDIDIGILGSDSDDGRVVLNPMTAVVVPWESHGMEVKHVEIGDARYLSLDRDTTILRNISTEVEIGYTTSHPVAVKTGSICATRPYYGTKTSGSALGGTIYKVTDATRAQYPTIADYPDNSYFIWYDLRYNSTTDVVYDNKTKIVWLTNTGTSYTFKHELINNYNNVNFDYSPYTIRFSLVHKDRPNDTKFVRQVTILQYPGIYIKAWPNSDNTVEGTSNNYISKYYGYVLIDGGYKDINGNWTGRTRVRHKKTQNLANDPFWGIHTDQDYSTSTAQRQELQWRTVWYSGGSTDLFKINVTVLPESNEDDDYFVIGDPRTDEPVTLTYQYSPTGNDANPRWDTIVDTVLQRMYDLSEAPTVPYIPARTGFAEAYTVQENADGTLSPSSEHRTLTYYYPTEASSRTRHMLAPSYLIASKFGGTEYGGNEFKNVTKEYAQNRCAAYQEDGFPAGRWRLPTRAEIRFIAKLSANNTFQFLFSSNSTYWSANGPIKVVGSDVQDDPVNNALLRCVYDTWYWGDAQLTQAERMTFVWGDKER